MRLALLWSDSCFLLMLLLGLLWLLKSLRRQPNRQFLLRLLHKPMAVSAGMVFCFFMLLGLMDCVRIVPANHGVATTVLDKLLYPLGEVSETTYSAPLALNQFVTETVFVKGRANQIYPRLQYPPQTLQTKADRNAFIQHSLIKALWISVCILTVLSLLGFSLHRGLSPPLISALLTLFALTFLAIAGYYLSRGLHVLGTGQIGEDILYLTLKSIRTALIIGLLTTLLMMPLALFLGLAAGYFGGLVDDVIQYAYTTLSSIPGVLLITASVLSLQTYISSHPEQFPTLTARADARLLALCLILGLTSWTSLCRLLRAETLKLREVDYVIAAQAMGCSWFRLLHKYLLPNVMHIVVITLVLDFSFLVLAEAVLSYVGVGVSPTTISWGNMINGARLELARDPVVWWPMLAAFMFMFSLVLAANVLADAVRDAA
jgi:peptide/nickel transport system permease protein